MILVLVRRSHKVVPEELVSFDTVGSYRFLELFGDGWKGCGQGWSCGLELSVKLFKGECFLGFSTSSFCLTLSMILFTL